ncbi:hypothetical protein PS691_05393 [Pseudomonas fluorescens]|uniref:Uncharacterized protein n=1 Tax=Pseudomonas fluorescens TaxID=294 RepID=A0A5E7FDN7_PSEFL|nr:hypothetical protein PS691_05393 [Pseudomonas fluorescens]
MHSPVLQETNANSSSTLPVSARHVASRDAQAHSSHAPACGDIPNRLFDPVAIRVLQQLIKPRCGLEHEGHALMDIGQVGHGVVAEAMVRPSLIRMFKAHPETCQVRS